MNFKIAQQGNGSKSLIISAELQSEQLQIQNISQQLSAVRAEHECDPALCVRTLSIPLIQDQEK